MPRLLKSGDLSEESIQKTVIQWRNLNPRLKRLLFHLANEGKRTPRYGKLLKDLGMRPGVSDLFIAMQRHGYGGAWIELKTKKGVLSEEQKEFLEDMRQENYFTAVCRSIDETIATIKWYCFGENQNGIPSSGMVLKS